MRPFIGIIIVFSQVDWIRSKIYQFWNPETFLMLCNMAFSTYLFNSLDSLKCRLLDTVLHKMWFVHSMFPSLILEYLYFKCIENLTR